MTNLHNNPNNANDKPLPSNNESLEQQRPHPHPPTTQNNLEVNAKHTPTSDNFQRGYLHGRRDQRYAHDGAKHDNRNTTRGLALGMGLTALLAIGLGLILAPRLWDANEPSTVIFSDPTEETEPNLEANPQTDDPAISTPPENTTIIENNTREIIRERETQVPVPSETGNEAEASQSTTEAPTAPPTSPATTNSETSSPQLPTAPESEAVNQSPSANPPAAESSTEGQSNTEPVNPNPEQ